MSSPGYTVRAATLADAPSLIQMQLDMAWETEKLQLDRATLTRGVTAPLRGDEAAARTGATFYVCEYTGPAAADSNSNTNATAAGEGGAKDNNHHTENGDNNNNNNNNNNSENTPQIVGMLMTTQEWSDWRAGAVLYIQSVFVTPPHRRRGVFRALYTHLRMCVVEPSDYYCGLRLYVETANERARRTYEALGMTVEHYNMMKWMKGDF